MRNMILVARRYASVFKKSWRTRQVHREMDGPGMPPRTLRLAEQYLLHVLNGITASDYYQLGLDSRELSWRRKREYVGHGDLTRFNASLNRSAYRVLVGDKVVFQLMCEVLRIPTVPFAALYTQQMADYPWRTLRNADDLRTFLVDERRENVFFKVDKGSRGRGALLLGSRTGPATWVSLPSGRSIGFDEVAAHLEDNARLSDDALWIVQDRVLAHPRLAAVIEGVTPTLRIMTLNHGDGRVELNGALVRFGDGTAPADNSGSGGVVFVVDEASGKLGRGVYTVNHRSVFTEAHPGSGVVVTGMDLPFWREAAELAIASARKLPQFSYLGWDIVITTNGPLALETNSDSGVLSLQKLNGAGLLTTVLRPHVEAASGIERNGVTMPR